MRSRVPIVVLVVSLVGAGAFALGRAAPSATARVASPPTEVPATLAATPVLPPGHPPIGASSAAPAMHDDPSVPALTWVAPAAWKTSPNPNAMRLATYRIPRAAGDTEDTELSVVRAGGSTDANIERWLGQFDEAGKDTRTVKAIHGMPVTIVEVRGTFRGGGMSMGTSASHDAPGWALLAAIVETPGSPYFFKMTGPAKSVAAAHAAFDALLASVTPASP